MMEAKLQIDKFGFTGDTTLPVSEREEKHLSDKLTILVNDINRNAKVTIRQLSRQSVQEGSKGNLHIHVQVRSKEFH